MQLPRDATSRRRDGHADLGAGAVGGGARRRARGGRHLDEAGWPDERSLGAALIEPVDPMVVTRIFEGLV
jgi:hypothetical protein